MKKLLFLLTTSFLLSACDKKDSYTKATVTGFDYTLCACCGGYYVKINDETFRATQYVENGILNTDAFPIEVRIKYNTIDDKCGMDDKQIKITAIKK